MTEKDQNNLWSEAEKYSHNDYLEFSRPFIKKIKTRNAKSYTYCTQILLHSCQYKKRLLLRCIHHLKSDLINNMDYMRISGNESSSVILRQTKWFPTHPHSRVTPQQSPNTPTCHNPRRTPPPSKTFHPL